MNKPEALFPAAQGDLNALENQLKNVIVGQDRLIREVVIALFAGGHVLLEGLPGLGKTHLAKALAASLQLQLGRIQCTPDLLPADLTGSEVLIGNLESARDISFRPGPVFANLVLVDEINRATPRTQAALLEAMQERQVTYSGKSHVLPDPFWVIATQNPIELEGTFPLPEAQLDRFMFKLAVPYPEPESLGKLLETTLDQEPSDLVEPVLSIDRVSEIRDTARQVLVAEKIRDEAIKLVLDTQPGSGANIASQHIRYGASPRALQSIVRAARVRALLDGRAHVASEDIAELATPALRHRILLKTSSELDGHTADSVLEEIIGSWMRG